MPYAREQVERDLAAVRLEESSRPETLGLSDGNFSFAIGMPIRPVSVFVDLALLHVMQAFRDEIGGLLVDAGALRVRIDSPVRAPNQALDRVQAGADYGIVRVTRSQRRGVHRVVLSWRERT
jgi:hypothetical protein